MQDSDVTVIDEPYLLVTNIPCHMDADGRRWTEALWCKDIVQHARYINKLTIVAPLSAGAVPTGSHCLNSFSSLDRVSFVDLPYSSSVVSILMNLRTIFRILWREVHKAEIVHVGVAGWPVPYGWAAIPFALIKRKFIIVIVESAFWRVTVDRSLKKRLRAFVSEFINRWCVNNCSLSIFTQDLYRKDLLTRGLDRGHVINASWIDRESILELAHAQQI